MKRNLSHVKPGNTLFFGRYPREADGAVRPLVWQVVAQDEDRLLVLCRDIIDARCYHSSAQPVSWEKSDLRSWLISDFVAASFNEEERESLIDRFNAARLETFDLLWDCGEKLHQGTPEIMDPVFLLHPEDLFALFPYEQDARCFGSAEAPMTPYAAAMGSAMRADFRNAWWLRATRREEPHAYFLSGKGQICCTDVAPDSLCGVRPAMWLRK